LPDRMGYSGRFNGFGIFRLRWIREHRLTNLLAFIMIQAGQIILYVGYC
jgi:hypothetical protein